MPTRFQHRMRNHVDSHTVELKFKPNWFHRIYLPANGIYHGLFWNLLFAGVTSVIKLYLWFWIGSYKEKHNEQLFSHETSSLTIIFLGDLMHHSLGKDWWWTFERCCTSRAWVPQVSWAWQRPSGQSGHALWQKGSIWNDPASGTGWSIYTCQFWLMML